MSFIGSSRGASWIWPLMLLAACAPPTEGLTRVRAEKAPFLNEVRSEQAPRFVLHAGDLVTVVTRAAGTLTWQGTLEGTQAARHGEMVEVKRSDGEASGFVFADDLGDEVKAPKAGYVCRRIAGGPQCEKLLRRIAMDSVGGAAAGSGDSAVVGYEACLTGACRLGVVRGRQVESMLLSGLTEARPAVFEGQSVIFAETHWKREEGWTGSSLTVLRMQPLRRALDVILDELDARHAPPVERKGEVTVEGQELVFRGKKRILFPPAHNALLYETDIIERYRLAN